MSAETPSQSNTNPVPGLNPVGTVLPWPAGWILPACVLGFVVIPSAVDWVLSGTRLFDAGMGVQVIIDHLVLLVFWAGFLAVLMRRGGMGPVLAAMGVRPGGGGWRTLGWALAVAAGFLAVGTLLGWLAGLFHWPLENPYAGVSDDESIAVTVVAVFSAPLLEELVFRGLIQTTLVTEFHRRWQWGVKPATGLAIFVTAALFTGCHGLYYDHPTAMVYVFLLALQLGGVRAVTNSLLPGWIGHGLNNAAAAAMLLGH